MYTIFKLVSKLFSVQCLLGSNPLACILKFRQCMHSATISSGKISTQQTSNFHMDAGTLSPCDFHPSYTLKVKLFYGLTFSRYYLNKKRKRLGKAGQAFVELEERRNFWGKHYAIFWLNCDTSNTSDTSTDTSDTICAYPLAIDRIRFGPQLTIQDGPNHHLLRKEQLMPDCDPSRYQRT